MQVILLERVAKLGQRGDVVDVKPGFARNYLLLQGKALTASKENIASFEGQKAQLEAQNLETRKEAEALGEKLDGQQFIVIRQASDSGALYGSVTQRDISDALVELGYDVDMRAVRLSQPIRRLGENLVLIQFERDLKQEITVRIVPDREIEGEREEETEETATPEGESEAVEPAAEPAASE